MSDADNAHRRLSQIELARHLGVSQQAISFALSGKGTLKQQTRDRILKAAAELGYRPNAAARAMLTGRFGAVGIVMHAKYRPYVPPGLFWGIQSALREANQLFIFTVISDREISGERERPRFLRENIIDGMIVCPPHNPAESDSMIEFLSKESIPTVFLNHNSAHNAVLPDDRALGEVCLQTVADRNYKRAAFLQPVTDPLAVEHFSAINRRAGVLDHAKALKIPCQSLASFEALDPLLVQLSKHPDPDYAILCNGAEVASEVMLRAAYHKLTPPKDFGLLCISDELSRVGLRFLSSWRVPFYWLGLAAVDMVMRKIERGHRLCKPVFISPHSFTEGDTLRPLPGQTA